MFCQEIEFPGTKQRFIEMLHKTLEDYNLLELRFKLEEYENCFFLKPLLRIQKKGTFIIGKFQIKSIDGNRIKVEISYHLTFIPIALIGLLTLSLLILSVKGLIYLNSGTLFGMVLFIGVPTIFGIQDRNACQDFVHNFLGEVKMMD